MFAKPVTQRLMEQMGDRVVGAQPAPALAIDAQLDRVARLQRAVRNDAIVHDEVARLLGRVLHGKFAAARREHRSGVADLTAGLTVKRGLIDDDRDLIAGLDAINTLTIFDDRQDDALGAFGLIAEKFCRSNLFAQREPLGARRGLARADPAAPSLRALALHRRVEAGGGDLAAAAAQYILGEVERETERVVEPEGDLAGEVLAGCKTRFLVVEQAQAALERLLEVGFLEAQRFGDQRLGAQQLGKGG